MIDFRNRGFWHTPVTTAAILLSLSFFNPAHAEHRRTQDEATAAGFALVRSASTGSINAAFESAQQMRRQSDAQLKTDLEKEQQLLASNLSSRGEPTNIQLADQQYFGGCITRQFRVHYAAGDLYWTLKFRDGRQGYYLYALDIRGLASGTAA